MPDSIPGTSALESARIQCTSTIGEPGHQPCAECIGETEGTLSVTAEWGLVKPDGAKPSLVVTLDLGDFPGAAGVDSWQSDTVLDVGGEVGTDLTLRYIPNG